MQSVAIMTVSAVGFLVSTIVNYLLSRVYVFYQNNDASGFRCWNVNFWTVFDCAVFENSIPFFGLK